MLCIHIGQVFELIEHVDLQLILSIIIAPQYTGLRIIRSISIIEVILSPFFLTIIDWRMYSVATRVPVRPDIIRYSFYDSKRILYQLRQNNELSICIDFHVLHEEYEALVQQIRELLDLAYDQYCIIQYISFIQYHSFHCQ